MWIQGRIPVDVALIHHITSLPKKGTHPMIGFGKINELKVVTNVKKKYKVERDKMGFLV